MNKLINGIVEISEQDLRANRFLWLKRPDYLYGQCCEKEALSNIGDGIDNDMEFCLVDKDYSKKYFDIIVNKIKSEGL